MANKNEKKPSLPDKAVDAATSITKVAVDGLGFATKVGIKSATLIGKGIGKGISKVNQKRIEKKAKKSEEQE